MSSNSVFISYRRSVSAYLAQLVWRELTDGGIDAFYDIESYDAGHFDQIILNQIATSDYQKALDLRPAPTDTKVLREFIRQYGQPAEE